MNAEGIQGPLDQRSDLIDAKQKSKRLCDEHTTITGDGNKQSLLHNKSGNGLINNLKASIITLATKQRMDVKSKLGFVANIILD